MIETGSARERGDMAESLVPRASALAAAVRMESREQIAARLAVLGREELEGLAVVLAALVDPLRPVSEALAWVDFDEGEERAGAGSGAESPRLRLADPDDWWSAARCAGMGPEPFHADGPESSPAVVRAYEAAKQVCEQCPVRAQCLMECLERELPSVRHGVWGGTTPQERRDAVLPEIRAALEVLRPAEGDRVSRGLSVGQVVERFGEELRVLRGEGLSVRRIAARLGVNREAVRLALRELGVPESALVDGVGAAA